MKHTRPYSESERPEQIRPEVSAGLPGAPSTLHKYLRKAGIDPDRLSILHLGRPAYLHKHQVPPWVVRMVVGYMLWAALLVLDLYAIELPHYLEAMFSLVVGLLIIQVACQVLVTATERFAARMGWTHYVAGTASEILSTLP